MRDKKILVMYLFLAHLMGAMVVWITDTTLIQAAMGYLFFIFMFLYMLEVKKDEKRKIRDNKLQIIYLSLALLIWGIFIAISTVSLIQFVGSYVIIIIMILYFRVRGKERLLRRIKNENRSGISKRNR